MIHQTHNTDLYDYCIKHSDDQGKLLDQLFRVSHLKTLQPRMVSGKLQGRFLSMISKLKRPKYIVEIGTFTGYAALCLAEGLTSDGQLITIEVNPELSHISSEYFERSNYSLQIKAIVGDALDILPTLDSDIDLVFMDAKKQDYPEYFNHLIDKLSPGGMILADNVLWDGKVLQKQKDKTTKAIHDFNKMVNEDQRVSQVMLPIRDGVTVIIKN